MDVLVIGATGTIGAAVADALDGDHRVVRASRGGTPRVDLADPASIDALFAQLGELDAVVCCAASAPLTPLADAAFVAAAAVELPRGVRINAVSPGWVRETLEALGLDPADGTPAAIVARAYVDAVTGSATGRTIIP